MTEGADGIEIAALCLPIAGEAPAGSDVREDFSPNSLYYRLRDARADARALERQADASGAGEAIATTPWVSVQTLAVEILTTQAKDLEVAAWYTEALLRRHGLEGLATGARLMAALVKTYWEDLHPRPDEEGMARRTAPVAGLNGEGAEGTLIQPLRKLQLFARPDGTAVALWQYQQAAEVAGIGDAMRRQQRLSAGALPFDTVETEAHAAAGPFSTLRRAAAAAAQAWQDLGTVLDAQAGDATPSMSRVRDLLAELIAIADRYAPAESAAPATIPASTSPALHNGASQPDAASAGIAAREDALRLLEQIATFFQSTEPHSPLAYTLRETVRRARLTWPELLEEIVPDFDGRAAILTSLGIRPSPPPE